MSLPPGAVLVTHGEPAGRTPVVPLDLSQALKAHWLTLVVRTQDGAGVDQDELQWSDVSRGEEDSSLAWQSAGSVGQTVVLVSVPGKMFGRTEIHGRTVRTFLTANFQAKKTIVLPLGGAGGAG